MQRLQAIAVLDESGNEPVEQLWVTGKATVETKVAGGGHKPLSEVIVPDPVDDYANKQGIVGGSDPIRELLPAVGVRSIGGELEIGRKSRDGTDPPG